MSQNYTGPSRTPNIQSISLLQYQIQRSVGCYGTSLYIDPTIIYWTPIWRHLNVLKKTLNYPRVKILGVFGDLTMSLHLEYRKHYCRRVRSCLIDIFGTRCPWISCLRIAPSSSTQVININTHRRSLFLGPYRYPDSDRLWHWLSFMKLLPTNHLCFRSIAIHIFHLPTIWSCVRAYSQSHSILFLSNSTFSFGFGLHTKFVAIRALKVLDVPDTELYDAATLFLWTPSLSPSLSLS